MNCRRFLADIVGRGQCYDMVQAGLLIGRDRLMRLNAPLLPGGPIGLDDVKRAKAELPNVAKELALMNGPAVASRFFNEKAEPYVPFHPSAV